MTDRATEIVQQLRALNETMTQIKDMLTATLPMRCGTCGRTDIGCSPDQVHPGWWFCNASIAALRASGAVS